MCVNVHLCGFLPYMMKIMRCMIRGSKFHYLMKIESYWGTNGFLFFLIMIYMILAMPCTLLYWGSPRYRSKRSIRLIMMTYVDRVWKKILHTNILSYLLLKLRAIKVDTSVFKGTILNWPDNIGSLCFSCQKHMCIQVWTRPMYDRDNWQIWNKSRNRPLEKPPKSLALHAR
jgi:hypothetical protein